MVFSIPLPAHHVQRDAACWAESLELQIPEWFLCTHTLPSTCLFSTMRLPFLKSTPCHMFYFPSCLSFSTCRFCIFCIRIMQRAVYNADASGPHSRSRDSGWGREGVMAANPPALSGPQGFRCVLQSENAPRCLLFCFTETERKFPSQSCLCLQLQKVSFPLSRAMKCCSLGLGCLEHETTLGAWDMSSRKSPWELGSPVSRTEKESRPRPELQPKTSTYI